MSDPAEETHVLYHQGTERSEAHEEVRITGGGDIVLEAWSYDWDYPSDEELVRLVVPAAQAAKFLAALNAALRALHGPDRPEAHDPVEVLKDLPIYEPSIFGVTRLKWLLDATDVEYA
ncbi:MAG TPA: hypothetical protein VG637_06090, partial [Actinomycetes bacterium]|nr:hypothetical protein [Actinomycetes bacterium]